MPRVGFCFRRILRKHTKITSSPQSKVNYSYKRKICTKGVSACFIVIWHQSERRINNIIYKVTILLKDIQVDIYTICDVQCRLLSTLARQQNNLVHLKREEKRSTPWLLLRFFFQNHRLNLACTKYDELAYMVTLAKGLGLQPTFPSYVPLWFFNSTGFNTKKEYTPVLAFSVPMCTSVQLWPPYACMHFYCILVKHQLGLTGSNAYIKIQ